MKANIGMKGYYRLFKKTEDGEEVPLLDHAVDNLILDEILDRLNNRFDSADSYFFSTCKVGTGTTPPTPTDRDIENRVADTNVKRVNYNRTYDSVNKKFLERMTGRYEFNIGAINTNITEVFIQAGNFDAVARSLIKDSQGNPTSVTVTAQESLIVEYTIQFDNCPTEVTGTLGMVDKDGNVISTHTIVSKLVYQDMTDDKRPVWWWCKPINNSYINVYYDPSFDPAYGDPYVDPPGTSTSLTRVEGKVTGNGSRWRYRMNLADGNFPGTGFDGIFKGIYRQSVNPGSWNTRFDPPIPKTDKEVFEIEFHVEFTRTP